MNLLPSLVSAALRRNIPVGATIELLAPCNLHCVHCYVTHSKENRLTLPVLVDLFDQMAEAGSFSVTLTGGEISLRKDLFEIIGAARTRYFAVRLLSSGTRWGPREWDRIASLAVQDVRLSLYAVDPTVHDAVTQTPGSHERTFATIHGLRERGVNMTLACPVTNINAHEVPRVIEHADALGLSVGIDPKITWTDAHNPMSAQTRASMEQLRDVYRNPIVRARLTAKEESCVPPAGDASPCLVGRLSPFIQCTGDVLPCGNWPRSSGNILDQRYLYLVRESPEFVFARSITNAHMTSCTACGDRAVCRPCVAMNLQERGEIGLPSQVVCDATAAKAIELTGESRQERRHRYPRLRVVA